MNVFRLKNLKSRSFFALLACLIAVSILLIIGILRDRNAVSPNDARVVRIGNYEYKLIHARTEFERQVGLSSYNIMPPKSAMIFVSDKPGDMKFWMKDMKFSIDIIWLSEKNQIIRIIDRLSPSTYPRAYSSIMPAKYVIEFPAGAAQKSKILEGDYITLSN